MNRSYCFHAVLGFLVISDPLVVHTPRVAVASYCANGVIVKEYVACTYGAKDAVLKMQRGHCCALFPQHTQRTFLDPSVTMGYRAH